MVIPLPITHLHLDHVRTAGVEPLGVSSDFSDSNVGLVEPGEGRNCDQDDKKDVSKGLALLSEREKEYLRLKPKM